MRRSGAIDGRPSGARRAIGKAVAIALFTSSVVVGVVVVAPVLAVDGSGRALRSVPASVADDSADRARD